jgi:RNA polymerase sigma factor (sigma-70 family)
MKDLRNTVVKLGSGKASVHALDPDLVKRCISGDERAWEQLVYRYNRLIYSIALTLCRDPEVAADILQQVCLELYRRLDEVRKLESLSSWVATVTRRKTYTYLRSKKPTEPLFDAELVASRDILSNIERQHMLQRALATLPSRSRRLMELLYLNEGTYEQVAAELGMPVASVGPTRIRCLKKLKKLLG